VDRGVASRLNLEADGGFGRGVSARGLLTDTLRANGSDLAVRHDVGPPDWFDGTRLQAEPNRRAHRPQVALYGLALVVCLAAPALVALDVPPVFRGPVLLAFFLLVPGCAVATLLVRDPSAELGLIFGISLGVLTLSAQAMLSSATWIPVTATYAAAGVSLPFLVGGLVRGVARIVTDDVAVGTGVAKLGETEPGDSVGSADQPQPRARLDRTLIGHAVIIGDAAALWAASLAHTRVGLVSGIGLVAGLPSSYYLTLALLVAGFAWAVADRRSRPALLALYTIALIAVLHGTTAVLYPEPRYAWVYKHLGVISYLTAHGAANREIDIYNNWPGFFALNAWFSRVTGWGPMGYTAWAQVGFELLNVTAIVFCLRGLTRDARLIWVACWIFICANWLGQDYLSPQAFGFFEAMIVIGLVIRCAPRHWPPTTRLGRWWTRLLERWSARLHVAVPDTARSVAPVRAPAALLLGAVSFGAVVVSHQLTPFVVITLVAALVVIRRARPVWLPLAMAALTTGWLWFAWPFVSRHFSLFSIGRETNAHPQGFQTYAALPGVRAVDLSKLVLIAIVAMLAVVGLWLSVRARQPGGFVAALVVAPAAAAIVQSYGGEGWLRAVLFALPWLAFLAAGACLRWRLVGITASWWRWLVMATVSAALIGPFVFAYFGQETMNYMSRDDVAVNRWYEKHTPAGSVIAFVASNAPVRLGARYASLSIDDGGTTVTNLATFPHDTFREADAARYADLLRSQRGTGAYLVISPSQTHYLTYYGLVRPGWVGELHAALLGSGRFRLVYRNGSAEVFQVVRP